MCLSDMNYELKVKNPKLTEKVNGKRKTDHQAYRVWYIDSFECNYTIFQRSHIVSFNFVHVRFKSFVSE